MKVSVICLVYNHEPYLRKCLDGFVNQKCNFEYEVLIHDDASTDNSASIIREYEEKYPNIIKPIYQTENQMSKGVKISSTYIYPIAKGEYIAWCEGDDYWTSEDKLQRQVDFLDEHPEYIACIHKYDVINRKGEKVDKITFGYYENEGVYTLDDFQKYEMPGQLATYVCRNIFTSNLEKYLCFEKAKLPGDMKITLFLLLYGDIWRLDEKHSVYRHVSEQGGNSWSSRILGDKKRIHRFWNALRTLEKATKENFGRKIKFKNRKNQLAFEDIFVDKNVFKITKKAIYYAFKEPAAIVMIFKKIFTGQRGSTIKKKL
ncbi:MAG: glycosyltransferase [Clostridia bacterium]|nr:glycosyltransferase [Clostridia bacterium]